MHTEPDWSVRIGIAALAVGACLASSQSGTVWSVLFGIPAGLVVVIWILRRAYLDRRKQVPRSRTVLRSACVALAVTGVAVWLWYAFGPGYYREYNRVKDLLAAIPGVTVIDTGGYADDLRFKDISAHIRVQDRGDLAIRGLTERSFSSATTLAINGIDKYSFYWSHCGYQGVVDRNRKPVRSKGFSFTLSLRGPEIYAGKQLIGALPVSIRSVQELVAHYDVLATWLEQHQGKLFEIDQPEGQMTYLIIPHPPMGEKEWKTRTPWQGQQPDPLLRQSLSRTCR